MSDAHIAPTGTAVDGTAVGRGFLAEAARRVVVFDGAMGTSIQARELSPSDFGGLDGCNEVLVRTRPDVVRDIHLSFLAVGCDVVETDTFGGAPWVLDEYGLADECEALAEAAARIAREACEQIGHGAAAGTRFVAGSVGPGTRSPTLSLGKDPSAPDAIDFDMMLAGYTRQARGLLAGGCDLLLVETVFDLLQAKAADLRRATRPCDAEDRSVPRAGLGHDREGHQHHAARQRRWVPRWSRSTRWAWT